MLSQEKFKLKRPAAQSQSHVDAVASVGCAVFLPRGWLMARDTICSCSKDIWLATQGPSLNHFSASPCKSFLGKSLCNYEIALCRKIKFLLRIVRRRGGRRILYQTKRKVKWETLRNIDRRSGRQASAFMGYFLDNTNTESTMQPGSENERLSNEVDAGHFR